MSEQGVLDIFTDTQPATAALYLVRGFYMGENGYQVDPDREGNTVTYANLTRTRLLTDYASRDEIDEWIASGEQRHTAKACSYWEYSVELQGSPLTFDPVSRTYMAEVPPFRWDERTETYVRWEPVKPTAAQRRALLVAADHPSVACSNTTDGARPCISASVAQRLADAGFITLARPDENTRGAWAGTTDAATITNAGRAALR